MYILNKAKHLWEKFDIAEKIFIIIMLVAVSFVASCMVLDKDGKYISDNPLEEVLEQAIEEETGLYLDITPFSPES